jgi:hypothetical protein
LAKRVMAVYDTDPLYTERFTEFISQKEQVGFSVMAFTALDLLKAYGEDHKIELLLISSSVSKEEIEKIGASVVVMLADGEAVS